MSELLKPPDHGNFTCHACRDAHECRSPTHCLNYLFKREEPFPPGTFEDPWFAPFWALVIFVVLVVAVAALFFYLGGFTIHFTP